MAAIDITGATRRKRQAAQQALLARHRQERGELAARVRQTRAVQAEAVRVRYTPEIDAIKQDRRRQVAALKERHRDEARHEDAALQAREAEREQGREGLTRQITDWKKAQRDTDDRQAAVASHLGLDWSAKDDQTHEPTPEERAEKMRRRIDRIDEQPSPSPGNDRPGRMRRSR